LDRFDDPMTALLAADINSNCLLFHGFAGWILIIR